MLFGSKNLEEFEKEFDRFINSFKKEDLLDELKQYKLKEELNKIDEYFDNITPKELDERLEKYINEEYNKEFEDIFFDNKLY